MSTKIRAGGVLAMAVGFLATTAVALAHHSAIAWNLEKRISVTGTVKAAVFRNPHGHMDLLVKQPDGSLVSWSVEMSAVNLLVRRGWKPDKVKVGDKVTVTGHPKKSPGNEIYMREIRLADGTVYGDPTGNDKQLD